MSISAWWKNKTSVPIKESPSKWLFQIYPFPLINPFSLILHEWIWSFWRPVLFCPSEVFVYQMSICVLSSRRFPLHFLCVMRRCALNVNKCKWAAPVTWQMTGSSRQMLLIYCYCLHTSTVNQPWFMTPRAKIQLQKITHEVHINNKHELQFDYFLKSRSLL